MWFSLFLSMVMAVQNHFFLFILDILGFESKQCLLYTVETAPSPRLRSPTQLTPPRVPQNRPPMQQRPPMRPQIPAQQVPRMMAGTPPPGHRGMQPARPPLQQIPSLSQRPPMHQPSQFGYVTLLNMYHGAIIIIVV